jgi:hypothetical protein
MGRPSSYDPETALDICSQIAEGKSLRMICEPDHMPAPSTVCLWNLENIFGFSEQYRRARQIQAELLADQIFSYADERGEDHNRSRLMVDTRKWYLSKVLPKIYGDKITQEHTGELSIKRVVTDL